jgi:hypothetical protein
MRFVPIDEVEEKKPAGLTFVPIDAIEEQKPAGLTFVPIEQAAEQPASRGFELPPVMDPFGINKPTGSAVAAPKEAGRLRTEYNQEFAPGSEAAKGAKGAAKTMVNLPAILGLQQDSEIAGFRQKELAAFAALDAGKEITPAEASKMGVDYARIQQYQRAAPEKRQEFKTFNQEQVDKAKVGVQEGLKLYAQYTKEMQQYQGRTPDATDIETATDFANWLSFNVGSGAVQMAPVILAAVTTGAPGAFAVGTALAGQETLQNRLGFVLEKTKDQTPQEQADAVAKYLRETGDVNAMLALASGALDLAGPVGTILRQQFSKELGKEAVQYATKTEAAKAAAKRTPRELAEEGVTGGAQEGVQITGEFVLEEQVGPVFSEDNIKRVFNAAAAEAAGGVAGSGYNVATAVGRQYAIEQAEKQTAQALELQVRQTLQQNNADRLAPLFDSFLAQVRAENPGMPEINVVREAGNRLVSSGGTNAKTSKAKSGRGKPSVSVPVGDTAGTPTTTAIETTDPSGLATTGVPAGDAGAGEGTAPASLTSDVPAGFRYTLIESPAYEGVPPLSIEDADFELEALQDRLDRGRQLTPEIFAQSEIGKRLNTGQINVINEGLRTDPAATIRTLRAALVPAPTSTLIPAVPTMTVEEVNQTLMPEMAEEVVERANEMVEDARMQGTDMPLGQALASARVEVVEKYFGPTDTAAPAPTRVEPTLTEKTIDAQTRVEPTLTEKTIDAQTRVEPTLTGETLGTTTPQAQQTETQGQTAPDAGTAVTQPAAPTSVRMRAATAREKDLYRAEATVDFGNGTVAMLSPGLDDVYVQVGKETAMPIRVRDRRKGIINSASAMPDSVPQNLRQPLFDLGVLVESKAPAAEINAAGAKLQEAIARQTAPDAGTAVATDTAAKTVPLDQVTDTTPASQLPANPATKLKPPGKRGGGRKPVERTPEQQAAADQQRKERQTVGRDSIRAAERAKAVVDKPFNMADYETDDAARAAAFESQQERDAALVEAYRILNDKSLARGSKAKQIAQQVVDSPIFDADNRAKAQNQAKQPATQARSDLLGDSTNSQPDTFYEGVTDATQAIDYIFKTGNQFERVLAQRIKPLLKGVKVVIVNNPKTDIPNAKNRNSFKGAMGLYVEQGKDRTIYLSNMPGMRGINNMTFLHEAVHGATMAQINAFIKDPSSVSPQARAAIESLQSIMKKAYIQYAVMEVKGRTDPLEDSLYKLGAFTDLKEFVAYGLTQPEMQDFLMKVPGQYKFDGDTLNRGLLTKFVQSIRKMFGIGPQSESAFQDLVVVTDRLLRAAPAPESKETITALAKKVVKQNKTLAKVATSNTAAGMGAGVGELIMATRDAKDAVRLLLATYDSLNVKSLRLLLYTLPTADIMRVAGGKIKNLDAVNDAVTKMSNMRGKMIRDLGEKIPAWVKFGQKYEQGGRTLGEVMHASTLLNVDPTLHANLADALKNDAELQKAKADYQAALANVTLTNKQRGTVKTKVTKRENDLKAVYEGGLVTNPDNNEKYTIEGWDKLGTYGKGEGHRIYKMARDSYRETFDLHQKLLIDKITKANIPGKANDPNTPKGKLIAQITQTFQEAQQLGVYFPLMRYGNYWLRIGKGKDGEFHMFESATARNYYARKRAEDRNQKYDDLLADGTFEEGDQLDSMRTDIVESSQMLKDIFKAIEDGAQIDPVTGRAAITDADAIKDQVYQMYLMTLPDRDIRKKFTHRQGKTGFSADVIRNFIVSQHTAANQLSRLAYADEIRLAIGASYAELVGNPDKLKLATFVDEIAVRATAEITPQVLNEPLLNKVASLGNQAVFYYLLTSPKSALIQMTQLPIVGIPVLAAKYGLAETIKVAARYSNLFNKFGTTKVDKNGNVITKWGEPSINDSSYINKHPDPAYRKALKLAWQAGLERGIYGETFAADMTARAKAPTGAYEGMPKKSFRFVLSLMSGAFYHLERISREIMWMSSFELAFAKAKKEGLANDVATKKAIEQAPGDTLEALFDYSQYNKPRIMKAGPGSKLFFQFMTYVVQMTSFLVRNFYKSLPFVGNKQDRKEAAIKFYGVMGMTFMFGGITGLWNYSTVMGIAEGVREALRPDMEDEDEDEFYDENDDGNPLGKRSLDLWFREWFLPTYFGPGSSIAKAMGLTDEQADMLQRGVKMGPISAITNINLGGSTSLDGMWVRDKPPAETAEQAFRDFVFSMLGPFGSAGEQFIGAFTEFNNGQVIRGVEKMLPAFFRGVPKAFRQEEEGETTRKGNEVMDAEDYTFGRLLGTTLGFQSTDVAEIQKKAFAAKQIDVAIKKERLKVLDRLDLMLQRFEKDPSDKNEENLEDAFVEIARFNYKNPVRGYLITQDTIRTSIKGRAERRDLTRFGISAPPIIFDLIEKSGEEK